MQLVTHNSDTGEFKVFSSADGQLLLRLSDIDIRTGHKISKAIRTAETVAARKIKTDLALVVLDFAKSLTD